MRVYNAVGFSDNEFNDVIQSKYGANENELTIAQEVGQIAAEFTRIQPVGAIHSLSPKERRAKRREYRRKCREYLTEKSKERIQPKGMIAGFLFLTLLSAIISFFVQMLLRKYFESDVDQAGESD